MDREITQEELIARIKENRVSMGALADTLHTSPEKIMTIAFNDENRMILLTETGDRKILYQNVDQLTYLILRHGLPRQFTFAGFQHSTEGISFNAFVLIPEPHSGPKTLLDALWQ